MNRLSTGAIHVFIHFHISSVFPPFYFISFIHLPWWYVGNLTKNIYEIAIAVILFIQIEFYEWQHYLRNIENRAKRMWTLKNYKSPEKWNDGKPNNNNMMMLQSNYKLWTSKFMFYDKIIALNIECSLEWQLILCTSSDGGSCSERNS